LATSVCGASWTQNDQTEARVKLFRYQ